MSVLVHTQQLQHVFMLGIKKYELCQVLLISVLAHALQF